jgi:hypothetical protein
MAIADTTDIIANWPAEGVSFRKIWDRAPAANEFFAARAKAEDCSRRPEERPYWKRVCADALARCGQWINACVENRLLVLKVRPPDKPWEEPVSLSASVALNLSAGESGQFLRGPNGEIFYDPIYYAAATLPPEPSPEPLLVKHDGPLEIRSERLLKRRTARRTPSRKELTKCTEHIVTLLRDSTDRRTISVRELRSDCCDRFKITTREFDQCRKDAFVQVPGAKEAWTKAGLTRR